MSPAEKIQIKEAKIVHMNNHKCSEHVVYIPKCSKCKKIYSRANCKRQSKKPIFKAIKKNAKIEERYIGLDHLGYQKLWDEQKSKCAICPRISDDLVVDHNHVTLKVKALLCDQCKKGIGLFKEKVEVLHKAIEYLKRSENL